MKSVNEMINNDKYYRSLYEMLWKKVWQYRPETVLVMGCHAGWDTEYLLKNTNVSHVTLIEPVDSFFIKYREQFKYNDKVKVINANWEKPVFFDKRFDMVTCFDCIEHSHKPRAIINNLMIYSDNIAISLPNGRWSFKDGLRHEDHGHGPHIQRFNFATIKGIFSGFGITEVKPVRAKLLGSFGFGMFVFVELD